ncbi:MAG TPA: hypothetical protein VMO47_06565 [Rhodothermales bacterium]|nr:hypothetical protein [Rhodothermales bacterium]
MRSILAHVSDHKQKSSSMSRIPLRLPDVGLNEIEGLVFIDGGQLVIRFGSSLLGLFDTDKDEMRVSPGELEDLRIKHGLFKDRLVVTPMDVDVLDRIPGKHPTSLRLRVWRKYRSDLEKLVRDFEGMGW